MSAPNTLSGIYNIWFGVKFTGARIDEFFASKKIPMHDSTAVYTWNWIELEENGKVEGNVPNPVMRHKTHNSGVVKIIGDMGDDIVTVKFSFSDLTKSNIVNLLQINPDELTAALTAGFMRIKSKYGKDMTAGAITLLMTHKEYGYTVAAGNKVPKIGSGADPLASIIFAASPVEDVMLSGEKPQEIMAASFSGTAVDGAATESGVAGAMMIDLTGFVKET